MLYFYFDYTNSGTYCMRENHSFYYEEGLPLQLLNRWCIQNGSSVTGRITAFQSLTGYKQKPIILISERSQQLFFPTHGLKSNKCYWIHYQSVFQIHRFGDKTRIIFCDGSSLELAVDYRVIRSQMNRCQTYLQCLNQTQDQYIHQFIERVIHG